MPLEPQQGMHDEMADPTDESETDDDFDASHRRSIETVEAAQERAHMSGERAAQQFVKILATLLGGLGLAIAAWLQRVFELAWSTPVSPLAWFLAMTLGFVALGLVALVLTAILDQISAGHASRSIAKNHVRLHLVKQRSQILRLDSGDEKSAKELSIAEEDAEAEAAIVHHDKRLETIDAWSVRLNWIAWSCLVAAFWTLGIGIIKTISHISGG